MTGPFLLRLEPLNPGKPPTIFGRGLLSSGVGFGVEYGTWRPGVKRVIDIAKVDCSGLFVVEPVGIFAGGTGM